MSAAPSLDPAAAFAALAAHGIRYVLTGSVAAMAYGVDLVPGDLDVAPALDPTNLQALGRLLREVDAKPRFVPGWAAGPSEEQCARWQPEPFDAAALDHRFLTPWGEFDVVPHKAGPYDTLLPRSLALRAFGLDLRVAHIDDLIDQGERWNRPRDRERRDALIAARARWVAGAPLPPLDAHAAWERMRA